MLTYDKMVDRWWRQAFHAGLVCLCHMKEHDGLVERWKRKKMENLLELHNKTPVWNDGEYQVHVE